ncbi:MAG: DUF3592 domain-containing protein [Oscillospiraceae bacterium]|nr:DUF3592 domain-containing protein [Oscillospiraceae bacterium]
MRFSNGQPVSLAVRIVFAVVGAVFMIIGIVSMVQSAQMQKLCTAEASGTVVELKEHRTKEKKRTRISYTPVVDYTYNGQNYRYVSSVSTNPPRYKVGERVTVMVNADEPSQCYIQGDSAGTIICVIFILIGAAMFVAFGIVTFVNVVLRKRRKLPGY